MAAAIETVREVAAEYLVDLTDDEAAWILWNETGFPSFWPDHQATPRTNLRVQLREFFSRSTR